MERSKEEDEKKKEEKIGEVSSTAGSCILSQCLGLRIYRPGRADMANSSMGPVPVSRASDITVNLDSMCVCVCAWPGWQPFFQHRSI